MIRLLLVLVAALLLWPASASAETLTEYRAALSETVQTAEAALTSLPTDASLAEYRPLDIALSRLESIDRVATDDGAAVSIDNRSLAKGLRGNRNEGQRALNGLRQLIREIDGSTEKQDWTRDGNARAALDGVLARPEFRKSAAFSIGQFLEELRTRLFQWLGGMVPIITIPVLGRIDLGGPFAVLFWLIAAALVIFMMVFFGFTWRSSRQNLARYAALKAVGAREQEDARAAKLAAQEAADAGDYRLAVHYLYLWAILHLAEQSRLRYDRSLTNREQLRALTLSGESEEILRSAVDAFDRLWYGHARCTSTEYGQFRSTVESLVEATT